MLIVAVVGRVIFMYFDHFEVPTAAEGPLTVVADAPAKQERGR